MPGPTLEAVVTADNKPFIRSMNDAANVVNKKTKEMSGMFGGVGRAFGGIGGSIKGAAARFVGVAAVGMAANSINAAAGSVKDMSSALDMGIEDFQRYSFAVEQAGGTQENFVNSMAVIIDKLDEARGGNEEVQAQFERLGISFQDMISMKPQEVFLKLSDALREGGADGNATAEVMEFLGRKIAMRVIPALKEGRDGFIATGQSARIMSEETVTAIEQMGDKAAQMKRTAMADAANSFVAAQTAIASGFNFGVQFWKGFQDAKKEGIKEAGPVMMDEIVVEAAANRPRRSGFWQYDKPTMTKKTGNEEPMNAFPTPFMGGFGLPLTILPSLEMLKEFGKGGFKKGFFPGKSGGLDTGGLMSGGLSGGGMGDAYGKVRRGDAAKAKELAKALAKEKDPQLEGIEKGVKALVTTWGGTVG